MRAMLIVTNRYFKLSENQALVLLFILLFLFICLFIFCNNRR